MAGSQPRRSSSLHCSLDGRAWTDLVSNSTFITGIDLYEDLRRLLSGPGGFPQSCLAEFLHESAHHTCFVSAVGTALAFLKMRTYYHLLGDRRTSDTGVDSPLMDDLMRYEAGMALFRPLSEGLALWAEHEILPSPRTRVASVPMKWSYTAFTDADEDEINSRWGLSMAYLLRAVRLGEPFIRRKANLLMAPMSCDYGGYLPGYLTLKRMWRYAACKEPMFEDTDFFYTFIRRFFFVDYGLVDRLLQTRSRGSQAVKSIVRYVRRRFELFFQLDFTRLAPAFEEEELQHYKAGTREYAPLATNAKIFYRGKRTFLQQMTLFIDRNQSELRTRKLKLGDLGSLFGYLMAQRDVLHLATLPVHFRKIGKGWVQVRSGDRIIVNLESIKPTRRKTGTLDVYLRMIRHPDNFVAITLSCGQEIVASALTQDIKPEVRRQFESYIGERSKLDAFLNELEGLSQSTIDFRGLRTTFEEHRYTMKWHATNIYARLALAESGHERIQDCYLKMQNDGFLSLLNGDVKLLKALATLSAAAAFGIRRDEVKQYMPYFAMPVGEALLALKECTEKYGLPLIAEHEGFLGAAV